MSRPVRAWAVAALAASAAVLPACGGGSGAPAPVAARAASAALQAVQVTTTVPARSAAGAARGRAPRFVSPSTAGVWIVVYDHADTAHATPLAQNAVDVSPGSAACGGRTGTPRACAVTVAAPPANDDFVVTTFDAPPAGTAFAAGAKVLGRTTLTQTIVPDTANTLALVLGGVVASIRAGAAWTSLPADGMPHEYAVPLAALDAGGNPIVTAANDPFADPIAVMLAETGASGHASLLRNGADTGAAALLAQATDAIAVRYDGFGAPGYAIVLTLGAPDAAPQQVRIAPLYLTSTSPYFANGAVVFTGAKQSAQIDVVQASPPAAIVYTATPDAACAGLLTVAVAGSAVTVTEGATAGSCTVAVGDGTSTVRFGVTVPRARRGGP